ncbi:MAG: hypothetical protein RLZZ24_1252, partial [Pseudomonadota bacterium]
NANGNITFDKTIDGAFDLTVNTAGITQFNGLVGDGTALTSLTTDADGSVAFNAVVPQGKASVKTTAKQTYNDAVNLLQNTVLQSSGQAANGNITFDKTIDGAFDLTVNTAGTTQFNGLVGDGTALTSVTTDADGSVAFNVNVPQGKASVQTTKTQTYYDKANLLQNTVLQSNGLNADGNITFDQTLDGAYDLTINTAGQTQFNSQVGSTTPLVNITTDAAGSTRFQDAVGSLVAGVMQHRIQIRSTGVQTYNDQTLLGSDLSLIADTVNFASFVESQAGTNITLEAQSAQVLGRIDISGNLQVTTGKGGQTGGVSQLANTLVHVGGNATFTAHTLAAQVALLNKATNDFEGSVTFDAASGGSWASVTVVDANAIELGRVSDVLNFNVTATNGNITQTQGSSLTVLGDTQLQAVSGDIQLLNANRFTKDLIVDAQNVSLNTTAALTLGASTVSGDLKLTAAGALKQTGPLQVTGKSDVKVTGGGIDLTDKDNRFGDILDIDTSGALSLTSAGPVKINDVKTGGENILISHGDIDLGKGIYGGKLKVTSNNGAITQSGPIEFKSDVDFDAGSGKIDLMQPKNLWYGGLLFKGGLIMINHPVLLSAHTNAASLQVRTEVTQSAAAKSMVSAMTAETEPTKPAKSEAVVSIRVNQTAQPGKPGSVVVEVSPEVTAGAKGFSFELDSSIVPAKTNAPTPVRATQPDGRQLPTWLKFDPNSNTFSADAVPAGAFPLQVKVSVGNTETIVVIQDVGQPGR